MKGHLHLLEDLDHIFKLTDESGLWVSGYWVLSETEVAMAKKLFLHKSKAERSFWGGDIQRIVPASEYAEMAAKHNTDPAGRWAILVLPNLAGKGALWEGADHAMAYKGFV